MKPNNRRNLRLRRIILGVVCFATGLALAQSAGLPVRNIRQVAISPDGTQVAWVESAGGGSAIYVQDLKTSSLQPRHLTAATEGATAEEGDVPTVRVTEVAPVRFAPVTVTCVPPV